MIILNNYYRYHRITLTRNLRRERERWFHNPLPKSHKIIMLNTNKIIQTNLIESMPTHIVQENSGIPTLALAVASVGFSHEHVFKTFRISQINHQAMAWYCKSPCLVDDALLSLPNCHRLPLSKSLSMLSRETPLVSGTRIIVKMKAKRDQQA